MHRLTPLIAPNSIALVGASAREGSVQRQTLAVIVESGFSGTLYAVNPNYDDVLGIACFTSVKDLPEHPDLAVLVVGSGSMEAAFDDAIADGARAITIFDSCYLENDTSPHLLKRLKEKARNAGVPLCEGNGMGFFNFEADTHVSFYHPPAKSAGTVALIAHSGSAFNGFVFSGSRYRFNLAVSPGQEIGATIADYMDYALELPSTRSIALFVEAVRDVPAFIAALEKASVQDVAVVAVKVGRTEKSAAAAKTHSSALVGNHHAFEALLERYVAI